MTEVSINRLVQTRIKTILSDHLTVAGRTVTITEELPDESFSEKFTPLIAVHRVESVDRTNYSHELIREELSISVNIFDRVKKIHSAELTGRERVELIKRKIQNAIEENIYPAFQDLAVFENFVAINDDNSDEFFGNNMHQQSLIISMPVIYERGKVFTI